MMKTKSPADAATAQAGNDTNARELRWWNSLTPEQQERERLRQQETVAGLTALEPLIHPESKSIIIPEHKMFSEPVPVRVSGDKYNEPARAPWRISWEENGAFIYADSDPRSNLPAIAHVYKGFQGAPTARLIAAAPALLEALRNSVERLEASQPTIGTATWEVIKQARAALALAEGRVS